MTSVERPSTITGAQTIDVDGSDKTKQVRKAGVPPASTRSYFAKNPLLPPFQSKGQEIISGSTLRDELAYEESEQIEAVNKTEAGLMENTYRIAPDPRKKFSSGAVKRITENVLVNKLTDVTYHPKVCRDLTLQISDEIKSQVKQLGFDRYKIVCMTHIGPKMGQAITIGSLCCWDAKNDDFTECSFANRSLFAVVLVFGLYQE